MELITLLKPSQSSTERVMSALNKVVENRYESVYKFKEDMENKDHVNMELFNKYNLNFLTTYFENSYDYFLNDNHCASLNKKRTYSDRRETVHKSIIHGSLEPNRKRQALPINENFDNPDSPRAFDMIKDSDLESQDSVNSFSQEYFLPKLKSSSLVEDNSKLNVFNNSEVFRGNEILNYNMDLKVSYCICKSDGKQSINSGFIVACDN